MCHRPTVLILAGRTLTALITVWCLGCSAYEPLLDSLLVSGAPTGMSCGSEMGAKNDLASAGQSGASISSSPAAAQAGYACDCGSCQSETPQSWTIATSTARIPSAIAAAVVELTSITRAPVAPPPELRTL